MSWEIAARLVYDLADDLVEDLFELGAGMADHDDANPLPAVLECRRRLAGIRRTEARLAAVLENAISTVDVGEAVRQRQRARLAERVECRRKGRRSPYPMRPLDDPPHQLQERRMLAGFRQAEVVDGLVALGLSACEAQVSRWERGREIVPPLVQEGLAQVFGCTTAELMESGPVTLRVPETWAA